MIPLKDNISSKTYPIINYLLIVLNTVVFIYELRMDKLLDKFIIKWGLVPVKFFSDFSNNWQTIFSSMFIHDGWLHFLGNMLFLFIFGDNVEDKLGHIKYFIFYIFCGFIACLLQLFFSIGSKIPMIGASGAIAGVLGAYFIFFPHAKILTLIPFGFFWRIIPIPAFFFLGIWFLIQFFSGTLSFAVNLVSHDSGGIAFWAHLGGFICGFMLAIFIRRRSCSTSNFL